MELVHLTKTVPPSGMSGYTKGIDDSHNDIAPCKGDNGCILPKNSTHLDCESKCNATLGCLGYVFAEASCSGRPIWTNLLDQRGHGRAAKCRLSQLTCHACNGRRTLGD
jgi:hypothetical protein